MMNDILRGGQKLKLNHVAVIIAYSYDFKCSNKFLFIVTRKDIKLIFHRYKLYIFKICLNPPLPR